MNESHDTRKLYKVRDLIAELQELDPDLPVVTPIDPEGNGYFWARYAVARRDGDEKWNGQYFVSRDALESDRMDEVLTETELEEFGDHGGDPTNYVAVAVVGP